MKFASRVTAGASRLGQLTLSPEIRASTHEGGVVFLHAGKNLVFTGNRIAAQMWEGFTDGQSPRLIAARLSRQYGVSQDQVEKHAVAFLADLTDQGILTQTGGDSICA